MKTNTKVTTQAKKKKKGFTLIEVIAVLVLLGILAAVAVPSYVDMSDNARDRAIDGAVAELNGREALEWGNASLAAGGYVDDATVFGALDTNLGDDFTLATPTVSGGSLTFQSDSNTTESLTRTASDAESPAVWTRPTP